jgi:predicted lipoprotein with Yx(FWY)xxD motif/cytochrome c5
MLNQKNASRHVQALAESQRRHQRTQKICAGGLSPPDVLGRMSLRQSIITAIPAVPLVLAAVLLLAAAADGAEPTVAVTEHEAYGHHLVASDGRSLYLFTRDVDGVSACYEQCAVNWPPLLVERDPTVGEGLDQALLGTTERTDGTIQVTYGGWPLYAFIGDAAPSATAGQGMNDVWFLVSPAGGALGQDATDATPTADVVAADDANAEVQHRVIPDELMATGRNVFMRVCANCHGDQGNNPQVAHAVRLDGYGRLENTSRMLRAIIHGRGYMGPQDHLSDQEIAAVATFVRNAWSNDFGPVTEEEVAEHR